MSETIEQLEVLRDERLKAIDGHRGHIVTLEDMIHQCEAEIRGLELAIKICQKDEAMSGNGTPALIGKYANMGLTDAILDVVQTFGDPPGMTARELVSVLEREGFKTKSKDLYNSTYPIAIGLLKQEKIKEGKKDGKRTFMRK